MDFRDKNVLVCGLARSGQAAALLLRSLGARVTAQDLKDEAALEAAEPEGMAALRRAGVSLYPGKDPADIISGFDLIIVSPGVPLNQPFAERARAMNVPVIGELELAYRLCRCPVIAITGTNGKTTTTALVGEIIKREFPGAQVVGNIGTAFSEKVRELTLADRAVAEVSSFQLESARDFAPHIAAILNITPDHLDRHGTFENYARIKHSIAKNQTEADFLILNWDDKPSRAMGFERGRVVYFSRSEELEYGVFVRGGAIRAKLLWVDEDIINISELRILGAHNVENALAAVAVCVCAGVPAAEIRAGLKAFKAVEHRIEYVTTINNVAYYNDSKGTNPDAAIKSILAVPGPIALIGGGYDKHADFTEWVKLFPGRVNFLALIGETAGAIMEACGAQGFIGYKKAATLKEAVRLCHENARPGGCVLLSPACASWDMFTDYEERGRLFKEYVMELAR